ncbi:GNAT family N-acetyltransferase [Chloroflexi bacterium TSY]|nr:GNAT family N-acetyltransferase [Chloroflexi bacterium TSY]
MWRIWTAKAIRVFEPGIKLPRSPEMIKAWIEQIQSADTNVLVFAIESLAGEFVGNANIHGRDERNGTFSCAVRIFRPFRRRGYAQEAFRMVLRFGFHELRYQKANTETVAINEASIKLHRSLGFQEEGRRRRNVFTDGHYYDEILFGMTREEFDAVTRESS